MAYQKLEPEPREALDQEGRVQITSKQWQKWFAMFLSMFNSIIPSVGEDIGDADATLTWRRSATTQLLKTAITAPRTITLSATGAVNGSWFEIIRTAAATGVSGVDIGGLKTLAVGQGCKVQFDGTDWILTHFWSL